MGKGSGSCNDRPALTVTNTVVVSAGVFGTDDYESGVGEPLVYSLTHDNGDILGELQVEVRDGYIRIRWIEVVKRARGKGVARGLMSQLVIDYPDVPLTTGGITEDGEALFAAMDIECIEEVDPELDD